VAEEYDGEVREITCRSICRSPMCPPYTALTEGQHAVFSEDKTNLVSFSYYFSLPEHFHLYQC
jgi:hypothetical protein